MLERHFIQPRPVHILTTSPSKMRYNIVPNIDSGPGSVVVIVTGYDLEGPGIESQWGRDFPYLSRPTLGPTQLPVQWVLVFPGGKERPGHGTDPSPPSSAIRPAQGLSACTRVTFTFFFFTYVNNSLDNYKMLSPDEQVKVLRFLEIPFKLSPLQQMIFNIL